ncbi:myrosinase 1-like [Culicoides brevitarsis]|uniref:myrosinase 1-like n=1 Tax=Culicoides brevitarsis TaxID=469753 RepID=UPI00307BFD3B
MVGFVLYAFLIKLLLLSIFKISWTSPSNISINSRAAQCDINRSTQFPASFKFGVATAAYQIEGAWNVSGKSPSVWDIGTHEHPERIVDHTNGDFAANSYEKYLEDIAAIKEVGFNHYRFSISWSRILPTGEIQSLNQHGLDYYHRVIDAVIAAGVEPIITMHHYDTPQAIQDLGGLANPVFADFFETYAGVLYQNFGDKVKTWLTFNEPFDVCMEGYGLGKSPPFVNASGRADYLCVHHVLLSHAKAYHLYRSKFEPEQQGKVSITLNSRFFYPKNDQVDQSFIDRALQFRLGLFAHPIFSETGGYPPVMMEVIARNSLEEGFTKSRLPEMTKHMKAYIKGTADFFAFNYYTSRIIEPDLNRTLERISWEKDAGFLSSVNPEWIRAKSDWLYSVPDGLRDLLKWIKEEYGNPEIIITENGWSDNGETDDNGRINYLRSHLSAILKAIVCDDVRLTGYTIWSIIDNFEWLQGYTEKFGLYHVDFSNPDRTRTPKKSSKFMQKVTQTHRIPDYSTIL